MCIVLSTNNLSPIVSCQIRLRPIPNSYEVYQGNNFTLQCLADNYEGDAIRWFINNQLSVYAVKSLPVNTRILPIVIPPSRSYQDISGLVVTIARYQEYGGGRHFFVSNLIVIPSLFNHNELLTFRCGSFVEQSNPLSLNYTVISKNTIPVYSRNRNPI